MCRRCHVRLLPGLLLLLATAVLVARPAAAEQRVLSLDPAASEVSFHLDATGHDVEGHLYLQSGTIRFDPATGEASGEVSLDARKAETGNEKRDKTMHKEVLESEQHPWIRFVPRKIVGEVADEGTSEFQLEGVISLLGKEHSATLDTRVTVAGDAMDAHASLTVPYVEWGLHDPSLFILRVAKQVQVTIEAHGSLAGTEAAPAAGRK